MNFQLVHVYWLSVGKQIGLQEELDETFRRSSLWPEEWTGP